MMLRFRRVCLLLLAGIALVLVGCTQDDVQPIVTTTTIDLPLNPIAFVQAGSVYVADEYGEAAIQLPFEGGVVSDPVWLNNQPALLAVVQSESTADSYHEFVVYDFDRSEAEFLFAVQGNPDSIALSPNNEWLSYQLNNDLYVLQLDTGVSTRVEEAVLDSDWSFDSKYLVYSTADQQLVLQELSIDNELGEPFVLLEADYAVISPVFLNSRTVAFEGIINNEPVLSQLSLDDYTVTPLVDEPLRTTSLSSTLLPEPLGDRILYARENEVDDQFNVWMIDVSGGTMELLLSDVYNPVWSADGNVIYYIDAFSVYRSTNTGENSAELVPNAYSVVTQSTSKSNTTR